MTLSNTQLPVDSSGVPLITGEATALRVNDSVWLYMNDWGQCLCDPKCAAASPPSCAATCATNATDPVHRVVAYRTTDLETWEPVGVVYTPPGTGRLFRPIVVWNARTSLFVMWYERYHAINGTTYAVSTSPSASGPFIEARPAVKLHGVGRDDGCGDATILVDDDGSAYHVRFGLVIERLTPDYLSGSGSVYQLGGPNGPNDTNRLEAPVFLKEKGWYVVLAGTLCCAASGGTSVYAFRSRNPLGPYVVQGLIADRNDTRAQASTVIVTNSPGDPLIWLGNQWGTSMVPNQPRDTDLLRFALLHVTEDGIVANLTWSDNITLSIPTPS